MKNSVGNKIGSGKFCDTAASGSGGRSCQCQCTTGLRVDKRIAKSKKAGQQCQLLSEKKITMSMSKQIGENILSTVHELCTNQTELAESCYNNVVYIHINVPDVEDNHTGGRDVEVENCRDHLKS